MLIIIGTTCSTYQEQRTCSTTLPLTELSCNSLLPPLHNKLGQMENSVTATDQSGLAFMYSQERSPAKNEEGVFVGPQIRKLFREEQNDRILRGIEKTAWNEFRSLAIKLSTKKTRLTTTMNLCKTCCCPITY
jgi:hypothetical protein